MKDGWEYKKLGEVCNVIGGGTPDTKNKEYWRGNIPWATVSDMNCDVIKTTGYYITDRGLNESSSRIIKKGEIVIATRVGLGKVCKLAVDTAINQDLKGVIPKDNNIVRDFIFYYFKHKAKYIVDNGIGATVKGVKIKFIEGLSFGFPSLSEQQSIVDYLDSAFAKIDAMKANAEKALNEAKALFQASLKEMLEPKEGWEEKKLSEVVNILNGYAFPSKAFGDNQELKVVKITNVGVGSFIEDISTLPQKMFIQDVCLKEGDIVIALTRTIISEGLKRAIIPSSYDGAMLNQRVASLRFSGKINISFLYYYLGCSIVSDYVWLHVNTLMQPNLSIKDLKSMPVCIPSLPEQQSIVETLDSLKSKVDRLQANYEKISQECDALKQAILRDIFE